MKLFVGNIPYSMGDEELLSLFSQHGEVSSAKVITDRNTGRSRGFGFVEMGDEGAGKAIEALSGQELEGRKIHVEEARPPRERG